MATSLAQTAVSRAEWRETHKSAVLIPAVPAAEAQGDPHVTSVAAATAIPTRLSSSY